MNYRAKIVMSSGFHYEQLVSDEFIKEIKNVLGNPNLLGNMVISTDGKIDSIVDYGDISVVIILGRGVA